MRSAMPPGTMMHAILPAPSDGSPVKLSFMTLGLTPLDAALGAQVAIFRLPP